MMILEENYPEDLLDGAIEAIQDIIDENMWLGQIPIPIYDLIKNNDSFEIYPSGWVYAVFSQDAEDLFLPQNLLIGYKYEGECTAEDYELVDLSEDEFFNKAVVTGFRYAEFNQEISCVRFLRILGGREIIWVQSRETDVFIPVDTGLLTTGPEFTANMQELYGEDSL